MSNSQGILVAAAVVGAAYFLSRSLAGDGSGGVAIYGAAGAGGGGSSSSETSSPAPPPQPPQPPQPQLGAGQPEYDTAGPVEPSATQSLIYVGPSESNLPAPVTQRASQTVVALQGGRTGGLLATVEAVDAITGGTGSFGTSRETVSTRSVGANHDFVPGSSSGSSSSAPPAIPPAPDAGHGVHYPVKPSTDPTDRVHGGRI